MRLLIMMVCFLVTAASTACARSLPPVEGLEALRRTFAGIEDFTAEISQEKRLSVMKRTLNMKGMVRFKKPDLFYMETATPYASRMVLHDAVLEQVSAGGEKSRIVLPPEQGLRQWFAKIAQPVTTIPEGMTVQADLTDHVYTVAIQPGGKGQVKELVIAFHEDGALRRLVIGEQNGDRTVISFRKVRRNTGLTEKSFRLN